MRKAAEQGRPDTAPAEVIVHRGFQGLQSNMIPSTIMY
jgi:hypothetical protein